jgi:hypothetical protein
LVLLSRLGGEASYAAHVLPGAVLLGLGLSLTVAPLTTTVLAAAEVRLAGVASGINNAVARAAGLLAVAVLPMLVGLSGESYQDPAAFDDAYRGVMLICAGLLALGATVAWATVRDDVLAGKPTEDSRPQCRVNCPVGAPPLEPAREHPAGGRRTGPRTG